jgi:hypothetical protein
METLLTSLETLVDEASNGAYEVEYSVCLSIAMSSQEQCLTIRRVAY